MASRQRRKIREISILVLSIAKRICNAAAFHSAQLYHKANFCTAQVSGAKAQPIIVHPRLALASRSALRVLRNLDTADRGRAIGRAGSEGMPLVPTKGINPSAARSPAVHWSTQPQADLSASSMSRWPNRKKADPLPSVSSSTAESMFCIRFGELVSMSTLSCLTPNCCT